MRTILLLGAFSIGCNSDVPSSEEQTRMPIAAHIPANPSLDDFLEETFPATLQPGMAVAIVKGERIVYAKALGYADLEAMRPVTTETPFMLASVSKPFTATAVMQLYEAGAIDLDDDVNNHLPFAVRNPNFPDTPITFRMLLGHASGIVDNWNVMPYCDGDCEETNDAFLQSYLLDDGALYDASLNFAAWPPGASHEYSNVGYALLGDLVEHIQGEPFNEVSVGGTLDPLRMEGGWFLADFDLESANAPAVPYDFDTSTGEPVRLGWYGFPDYPDGQLRTDAVSLASYLLAAAHGGRYRGPHILDADTLTQMRTPDGDGYAMGFAVDPDGTWGHSGYDVGCWAEMWWNPNADAGVILLTNGVIMEGPSLDAVAAVWSRLWDEAWAPE